MILKNELTLVFDETNINWQRNADITKDINLNRTTIEINVRYFNDMLKNRGYLYLNQIYEVLGFEWDPNKQNVCYIYETDITEIVLANVTEEGNGIKFTLIFVKEGAE